MTRVRLINIGMLPLHVQKLLRSVKDRSGVVVDRYFSSHQGYEVLHIQLEPTGWGIKVPVHCCKEIDQNSQIEAEREEERRRMIVQDYISEGLGE